jgi:hypothetical protein
MKAVLHRHTGQPGRNQFEEIVLSENAVAFHVNGEFVTVQNAQDVKMVAALRLREQDYVRLED